MQQKPLAMNRYSVLLFILLGIVSSFGQAQELVDHYRIKVAGTSYHKLITDNDGNTFIYGVFDELSGVNHGRLLKLNASGNLVASFHKSYMNDFIRTIALQPDKKILVGGSFTLINNVAVGGVVRLNEDGTIDNSFSCALSDIRDIKLQSTGKIIVLTGQGVFERLNTDGSIDHTFNFANFAYSASEVAIGPDNSIFFYGSTQVHKLTANGEDDPTFALGAGAVGGHLSALEVQVDGKLLVGGFFSSFNGVNSKSIVRLLSNGQVDNSFSVGVGPEGQIFEIVERPNHNILIGGQFYQFNGQPASLVELNSNGSLSRIIATVSTNWITSIDESTIGKITMGGEFRQVNGQSVFGVCRFNSNYTIDATFKPVITFNNSNGRNLLVRNDLTAVITSDDYDIQGIFSNTGFVKGNVFDVDRSGLLNPNFKPYPGAVSVAGEYLQEDGKLLISGYFGYSASVERINVDGTKDASFSVGSGLTSSFGSTIAQCIHVSNGMILLGGNFTHYKGVPSAGLVGIDNAGNLQRAFTSLPTGSYVWMITHQSGGKLVLVGDFPFPSGSRYIVRLNLDGSIDETFYRVALQGGPADIAIDSDDNIYLAGDYLVPDGALLKSLIKLTPDGQLDGTFNVGSGFLQSSYVTSVEILPDQKIAVGGYFQSVQGVEQHGFAILNNHGTLEPLPYQFFAPSSAVTKLQYRRGQLFLTGRFLTPDFKDTYGVAKVLIESIEIPAAPADLNVVLDSPGKFKIMWTDLSETELGFVLERAEGESNDFHPIDTLNENSIQKIDNIQMDVLYSYRVRAFNEGGYSSYSNIKSLQWSPVPEGSVILSVPVPTTAAATLTIGGTVNYHLGYIIERSVDSEENFVALDTIGKSQVSFVNSIEPEKVYRYRVKAYNNNGMVTSNVEQVSWKPSPSGTLSVSIEVANPGEATLTWVQSLAHNLGFIIQRSAQQASSGFVALDTVATTVSTFMDITDGNQSYDYRILAYNANGSLTSNTVSMIVTGTELFAVNELHVYPNPVTEKIFINVNDITTLSGKWKLISTNGAATELNAIIYGSVLELDVRDRATGVFVLQYLSDDGKRWMTRVIKK